MQEDTMPNNPFPSIEDEVVHQEQLQHSALGILDVYEELRALCPGYFADIVSGEHERVAQLYVQSSQRLAVMKPKITLQPGQRPLVKRLIDKLQSGNVHLAGG
jgi:hypothetical protein